MNAAGVHLISSVWPKHCWLLTTSGAVVAALGPNAATGHIQTPLMWGFYTSDEEKLLCWHDEGHKKDGVLRHPADACHSWAVDSEFLQFRKDSRNIRFSTSTDGINPFDNMSS